MISGPSQICKGCGNAINSEPFVQALNSDWHLKCFRCSTCGSRLNNWYIQNNGSLYCKDDYWSKIGDRCNRCSQVISGPLM
ncbi:LIM domain kinase 1 isoform X2, partial [Biomphalaria pfeifferi]